MVFLRSIFFVSYRANPCNLTVFCIYQFLNWALLGFAVFLFCCMGWSLKVMNDFNANSQKQRQLYLQFFMMLGITIALAMNFGMKLSIAI